MIPVLAGLLSETGVRVMVAGLALAGAALGGAELMANHKNAEIADLRASHSAAQARAAQDALYRLQDANRRGDALAARAAAAESLSQTQTEEKNDAVRRLTAGRPCLGSTAVRLLNQPAGLKPAAALPETARQPAEPDAAFATDTDVGLWAAAATRQYDTCRGRLAAVAEFFED